MKIGLYAIVDVDACTAGGHSPLAVASGALEGGAVALQLRAKRLETRPFLSLASEMAALSGGYGVPFFVNDRLDIALATGAGLHIGQDDLPVAVVRSLAPTLALGVSTHTREELEAARDARPDYVAFGPVFPTASKEHAEPVVGLAELAEIAKLVGGLPLVAIGGISAARVGDVRAAGATLVAAIAGLLPPRSAPTEAGVSSIACPVDRAFTISAVAERARAYDRAARAS